MDKSSASTVQPKPVLVEILAYAPTQFYHCQHCEFIWQQVGAATSPQAPLIGRRTRSHDTHYATTDDRDSECDRPADSLGRAFHQEQLESSIPDDLKREYADLSNWVHETVDLYGGRVVFKIIDAASLEGLLKSVQYRVRRYPAFLVDGKDKYIGADFDQVKRFIDNRLALFHSSSTEP